MDTHAFLWWLAGNRQLPPTARRAIADEENEILVSADSTWEIATKHRLGKIPGAGTVAVDVSGAIAAQDFLELPITVNDAARAGSLPGAHRDPFDRMFIAQALSANLHLVSNDLVFDHFGVHRLW